MHSAAYRTRSSVVCVVVMLLVALAGAGDERDPCAPFVAKGPEPGQPFDFAPFLTAVTSYVQLHRAVEQEVLHRASMPADRPDTALGAEITRQLREAKAQAAEGDLFSPCVSEEIRHRIDESLGAADYRDLA